MNNYYKMMNEMIRINFLTNQQFYYNVTRIVFVVKEATWLSYGEDSGVMSSHEELTREQQENYIGEYSW